MDKNKFFDLIALSSSDEIEFEELIAEIEDNMAESIELMKEYLDSQDLSNESVLSHVLEIVLTSDSVEMFDDLIDRLEFIPSVVFEKLIRFNDVPKFNCVIGRKNKLTDLEKSDLLRLAIENWELGFDSKRFALGMLENGFFVGDFSLDSTKSSFIIMARIHISDESEFMEAFIKAGGSPFAKLNVNGRFNGVPLMWYYVSLYGSFDLDFVLSCSSYVGTLEEWNSLDEWGRNLLHVCAGDKSCVEMLLAKGVDLNHRAEIGDIKKVVSAKMKGELPEQYGKTPRELLKERGLTP